MTSNTSMLTWSVVRECSERLDGEDYYQVAMLFSEVVVARLA